MSAFLTTNLIQNFRRNSSNFKMIMFAPTACCMSHLSKYSHLCKHFILSFLVWGLFHKTFFFVIYGHFAVNYKIFAIYEQIYGQNLAVAQNP